MKNHQKGFAVPILLAVIAILAVSGSAYLYEKNTFEKTSPETSDQQSSQEFSQTNTNTDEKKVPTTTNEEKVLTTSRNVIAALAIRDYKKLDGLVSSDGLSIDLYPRFDVKKNLIPKNEISQIPQDTRTYLWGYTDGKGDPINLTRAEFLTKWIYTNSVDYSKATDVAVNKKLGSGNSLNTIAEDVAGRTYTAFHFPILDQKYMGMDWTTLYLIFDYVNGEYKLRGIAKDNWTI